MTGENLPAVGPTGTAQDQQEAALSAELRDSVASATRTILINNPTLSGSLHVIEKTRSYAETMSQSLRHPDTPPVECKKGCAWCCHQTIPVTAPEVFAIIKFLGTLDPRVRMTIEDRLRKLDKATRGLSPKARGKLRIPCAFLQDNICTIHGVRPLACAGYSSFDVRDCKRAYRVGFAVGSITGEKARMVVYGAVRAGFRQGLHQSLALADANSFELTAAMVCALDAPSAAEQWVVGGKVFATARLSAIQNGGSAQ